MNETSVSSVEGAEAELDQAEASLQRLLGGSFVAGDATIDRPSPSEASEPAPPPSKVFRAAEASCDTACDALASMRRASDRICVLAGAGERCDAARARLSNASKRVQSACPECES